MTKFSSSDAFRVNTQQRTADVWLVYKCDSCNSTWNCTILSRVNIKSIAQTLLEAFHSNDQSIAYRYAFDYCLLKAQGAEVTDDFSYIVEVVDRSPSDAREIAVEVVPTYSMRLTIGRFLANRFGLSISNLKLLANAGGLIVREPQGGGLATKLLRPVALEFIPEELARTPGDLGAGQRWALPIERK